MLGWIMAIGNLLSSLVAALKIFKSDKPNDKDCKK